MSHLHRTSALAAVLLVALLLPGVGVSSGAANDVLPISYTLYGDSIEGWGLTNTSITSPGPNLTVYVGAPVILTLIGNDQRVLHNWFIDYDGSNTPGGGEPSSNDFKSDTGPLTFQFTPDRAGNFTYKCRYHTTMMVGTIHVLAPKNVTLYGDSIGGWGFTNATIRSPGPRFTLVAGTNVTFTFVSNDSNPAVNHDFFIDYDGSGTWNVGEPRSQDFNSTATLTWPVHLDRAGNFTYRCMYHSGMLGNIIILGPPTGGGGLNVALIPGIMIGTLGIVLIFAAAYHVRAVRAAKRMK